MSDFGVQLDDFLLYCDAKNLSRKTFEQMLEETCEKEGGQSPQRYKFAYEGYNKQMS